jgi:hypothetical protein
MKPGCELHAYATDIRVVGAASELLCSSCTLLTLLSAFAAADQRFKRIVLRASCMADHFPAAYKRGLTDVLSGVAKKAAESGVA